MKNFLCSVAEDTEASSMTKVPAENSRDAAIKFMKTDDGPTPTCMVYVRDADTPDKWERFEITAKITVDHTARKLGSNFCSFCKSSPGFMKAGLGMVRCCCQE